MKLMNNLKWAVAAALLWAVVPARAALPPISENPCIGSIVVDAATGEVLKEDRSGRPGYPASMLKLMNLFVTLDAVRDGGVSLSDNVRVSKAASRVGGSQVWLDPRETFTLEELLYAMMVHSANDAAYLIAEHVGGSVPAFVGRMNEKARALGLSPVTHFISPHGLPPDSGRPDMTTAADFAKLCVALLREHPETLGFTSVKHRRFRESSPQGFQPIDMDNHNHLLGTFPGCDGLKTGYIDESGYNLSLTAVRGETRFLSVTMGGPGNNAREGQAGRVHDGTELMEWAFAHFADSSLELKVHPYLVRSFNASQKMLSLVPAFTSRTITVPYVTGATMAENLDALHVEVQLPDYCWGSVDQGQPYGKITISIDDYLLQEIPLVADRTRKNLIFFVPSQILS